MIRLLQHSVTVQANTRPHAPAIVAADERLTYHQLEARSNRLARLLRDTGCRRGDRVAVLMPKSPLAIVATVGIYKADGIFVPLDPMSPPARLQRVLDSADVRVLLAGGGVADTAAQLKARVINVTTDDLRQFSAAPIASVNTPTDPAHLLFTSGSTGNPKGVIITHANVARFVDWAVRYFGISTSDRVSGHSPLHFDLSTFDLFGTFAAGAELHLVPPDLNLFPQKLADFIRSSELTQWFSVPSVLNYMAKFDSIAQDDFPTLKRLMWCGEVFPTPALIHWMTRLPHVTFTNLYGPTEATIASGYHTIRNRPADPTCDVPIGRGCDGEELLVLDDQLAPVASGTVGQLYIRGVGLSPGYWRDPERTAAAFITRTRPDGLDDRLYRTGDLARAGADDLVYFVGRADSQIKSRGYRIELGEIEAALSTLEALQEAAVLGIPTGGFEGTLIACAYAPRTGRQVSPGDVRKALSALVPPYMLPSRWLPMAMLPKNATGKIDRRTLQEQFAHGSEARPA
jgi:amino acid adenylation domain-containing protein